LNDPAATQERSGAAQAESSPTATTVARGASAIAAAAFAAGIAYCWAEMIFRYEFTHSPSLNSELPRWRSETTY
jgi:hypothetical protein